MLLAPAVSVWGKIGSWWGVEKTLEILWLSSGFQCINWYTVSAFNISCRGHNEKKVEKRWYIGNLYPLLATFSISLKLFRNRKCKHCDVPVLGELWDLDEAALILQGRWGQFWVRWQGRSPLERWHLPQVLKKSHECAGQIRTWPNPNKPQRKIKFCII